MHVPDEADVSKIGDHIDNGLPNIGIVYNIKPKNMPTIILNIYPFIFSLKDIFIL